MIPGPKAKEVLEIIRGNKPYYLLSGELHVSRDYIDNIYNDENFEVTIYRMEKMLTNAERPELWHSYLEQYYE